MKDKIRAFGVTLVTLLRVARHSYFRGGLNAALTAEKVCFVLGNGPSLATDLAECRGMRFAGDIWCVNQFAESAMYEQLQPKNYVFADSSYWRDDETERLIEMRAALFHTILSKTTWQLTIYVPFGAKSQFQSVFGHSSNIKLHYYNNTTALGYRWVVKSIYDYGLGMPWVQNVLVAALFLSVRNGYKKVYLLGADHSWHETLALDNENRVCFRDRHFYQRDAKLVPFTMGGDSEVTFNMSQLFFALSKMFEGYLQVNEYAQYQGAKIMNASSITYIDAFERVKLGDIPEIRHLDDDLN